MFYWDSQPFGGQQVNPYKDTKGPVNRGTQCGTHHWQKVQMYCEFEGSLEPECIDAWYGALAKENSLEWAISLEEWFNNQLWIAFFAWAFAPWAGLLAFYFTLYPDRAPSIQDAPWEDVPFFFRGIIIMITVATAGLVKPDLFMWSQVFTFGESDLIDFEIIYMTGYEPALYFAIEAIALPFLWAYSFLFVSSFWWLYAAELFWVLGEIFFWAVFGGGGDW